MTEVCGDEKKGCGWEGQRGHRGAVVELISSRSLGYDAGGKINDTVYGRVTRVLELQCFERACHVRGPRGGGATEKLIYTVVRYHHVEPRS
jgi:hypothetical protein